MTQASEAVFEQIVRGSGPHAFHRHLLTDAAGHDNEWNLEPPLVQESQGIAGRKLWHGEIRQNEIWWLVEGAQVIGLRIDAAGGQLEPGFLQHVEHERGIIWRVFEQQEVEPRGHCRPRRVRGRAFSLKKGTNADLAQDFGLIYAEYRMGPSNGQGIIKNGPGSDRANRL